ncbi:MAG: hypothetical protein ACRECH_15885 [Nitrososphaerales archaeon]
MAILAVAVMLTLILGSSTLRGYFAGESSSQTPVIQQVNARVFYLGNSAQTLSLETAIQRSAYQFTHSDDPTQLSGVGTGVVVYVDDSWYHSFAVGAAGQAAVQSGLGAVLQRGIPVIVVLPNETQGSSLLAVLSTRPVPTPGYAVDGSPVHPTILGLGMTLFPPDTATNVPSSVGYWASDTNNVSKDASWFASDSLNWALHEMNVPAANTQSQSALQGQTSPTSLKNSQTPVVDTACDKKNSSEGFTPQTLLAIGDPCPSSGIGESLDTYLYNSWNLCNTNGGLGIITAEYDTINSVTNSGSPSYNFYDWYLDTNEVPGHEANACTSGGTNWYGADLQEYINVGSGQAIWCYGPGTTTGQTTAGVDVGFSAGSDGASGTVGASFSYSIATHQSMTTAFPARVT